MKIQKIRLSHDFVLELKFTLEPYNLIGQYHFDQYLKNQIFPKYEMVCQTILQLIYTFVIDQIQKKKIIITEFFIHKTFCFVD